MNKQKYLFRFFSQATFFVLFMTLLVMGCSQDEETPVSSEALGYEGRFPAELGGDMADIIESLKARAVKIGMLVEVESHISPMYGAQLAVYEVNQSGGVLGIPVESVQFPFPQPPTTQEGGIISGIFGAPIALIVKDNKDDPMLAQRLAIELITEDEVTAIIGPNYSYSALTVAPVAQEFGVPMVATAATDPDITKDRDYVFLSAFADTFQGKVMAQFARESLRARTAATLIDREDPYAIGLSKYFKENFINMGGRIVAEESYLQGDTDFTAQLTAIANKTPDVIFMPGFTPEVPMAVKQARSIPQKGATGITAIFLGGDGWDEPELLQNPDEAKALEGSYFSTFFSPETADESSRIFINAYKSMFGITPDAYAAVGYDALKLVATAIRRAGSTDKKAIRDQLAETRDYDGATYIRSYDANRHPIKSAVIMHVINGRAQFHKQVEP